MNNSNADLDQQGRMETLRTVAIVAFVVLAGFVIFFGGKATSAAENKAISEASQKFTLAQQVASACASSETAGDLGGLCQKASQIVKEGPQGSAGLQGPPGDTGADGPLGPKGEQGVQGIMGLQGIQGLQGLLGKSVPGTTGAAGPQGDPGVGVVGPQGDPGSNGSAGANAPTISGIDCDAGGPFSLTFTVHLSDGSTYTASCSDTQAPTPTPTPTPSPTTTAP